MSKHLSSGQKFSLALLAGGGVLATAFLGAVGITIKNDEIREQEFKRVVYQIPDQGGPTIWAKGGSLFSPTRIYETFPTKNGCAVRIEQRTGFLAARDEIKESDAYVEDGKKVTGTSCAFPWPK